MESKSNTNADLHAAKAILERAKKIWLQEKSAAVAIATASIESEPTTSAVGCALAITLDDSVIAYGVMVGRPSACAAVPFRAKRMSKSL